MSFGAVDIGNTAVKLAIWNAEGQPALWQSGALQSVAEAASELARYGVTEVAYSTTRNLSEEEKTFVETEGWWRFTAGCRLPVGIRYATPETLGLDRLAGAVAAVALYRGEAVLIADSGTALTLDVVSASGEFLGGNISVGLAMRIKALHQFTSRLPEVDLVDDGGLIGSDTMQALRLGAIQGLSYEIAGTLAMALHEFGCRRLVLTGGNARFLKRAIDEAVALIVSEDVFCDFVPELVEYGLKVAYDYNHDK